MYYKNLNINTWDELSNTGDVVTGYHGIYLNQSEGENSDLLIFKDEYGNLHFVIAADPVNQKDILDPKVNGLKIYLKKYKFQNDGIKQFIDLECSLKAYIAEFTEIVREIADRILSENELPLIVIRDTVNIWKSFWATLIKQILSEEEQLGLICEMSVLKKLCEINPVNGLNSWKGPLKEKYDFIFSEWVFEVKGAQRKGHVHTINGIDQLKPPKGKGLTLISFLATTSEGSGAKSLQDWIDEIEIKALKNKADLIEQFYNLLTGCGYSRIYREEYKKTKFDIYDGKLYKVNESFPSLTSDHLKQPLDSRVTEIRYTINLNDISGEIFENIALGNYFF